MNRYIILLIFSLVVFATQASSFAYDMNHKKYEEMTPARQRETIISIMNIIVESEKKTSYSSRLTPKNFQEINDKSVLLRNLYNQLFAATAHARDMSAWGEWRKNAGLISDQLSARSKDRCFYAGWPSLVTEQEVVLSTYNDRTTKEKKRVCTHPSMLPSSSPEFKGYSQAKECKASSSSQMIACNPVIFGYKKISANSLFCIEDSESDNGALAERCRDLALGVEVPPGVGDFPEQRLKYLKDGYGSLDPDTFNNILSFITNKCLCPESGLDILRFDIREEISKTRVCDSYMSLIGPSTCEMSISEVVDFQNAERIKKIHEKISETFPEVYQNSCSGGSRPGVQIKEKITCRIDITLRKSDLLALVSTSPEKKIKSVKWENSDSSSVTANFNRQSKQIIKAEVTLDNGKKIYCKRPISFSESTDGDIVVEPSTTQTNPETPQVATPVSTSDPVEQNVPEESNTSISSDTKPEHTIKTEITSAGDKIFEIKATVEPENKDAKIDWSITDSEDEDLEISEDGYRVKQERTSRSYEVCAELMIDSKSYGKSCQTVTKLGEEIEEEPAVQKPKIETKITDKGRLNYKIEATVKPEAPQAEIRWSLVGAEKLKVTRDWIGRKPTVKDPIILAGQEEESDELEKKESIRSITQTRASKSYQACAAIYIDNKQIDKSCETVDKLEIAGDSSARKDPSGLPPVAPRAPSDVSAVGIK